MPRSLFPIAATFILAIVVLHASSRMVSMDMPSWGHAIAYATSIIAFAVLCATMWFFYRKVPSPGMLCCAAAVGVLGMASAIDVGILDRTLGRELASELGVHAVMTAIVLLVASVLLMPSHVLHYLTDVVIPALLGRNRR